MSGPQLFILIALLFISTSVSAAYADSDVFNGRSHPRDLFRRTSIADHVKGHLEKGTADMKKHGTGRGTTYEATIPVPAGTTSVSTHDLNQYAHAFNTHLSLDKHESHKDDNHVMAAAHRTGSNTIYLSSQPKGAKVFEPTSNTNPELASKMKEAGQVRHDNPNRLNHHAETAAVNKGMQAEGSTTTSEWSVGQHGHFRDGNEVKEPCVGKCKKTFDKAGVTYQDKDGVVRNPQKLATPAPGTPPAQHAPASPHQAPASVPQPPTTPPNAPTDSKRKKDSPPSPEQLRITKKPTL